MKELISCTNCWHNPMQYGTLGTCTGYCVFHRVVLKTPSETSCAAQMRKDLLLLSAQQEHEHHKNKINHNNIINLHTNTVALQPISITDTDALLQSDPVGSTVYDYGDDIKVASIANLNGQGSVRAEIAMVSLGRAYVHQCMQNGAWTSGIHLLQWVIHRIKKEKQLKQDIQLSLTDRYKNLPISSARQEDIERWSLLVFRLTFVSDIGFHAVTSGQDPSLEPLAQLPNTAMEDTDGNVKYAPLKNWLHQKGLHIIQQHFSEERYRELRRQLHAS
jgi:hypothetical protein